MTTHAPPNDKARADTAGIEGWRCFHCGDFFTDADDARDHFGSYTLDDPACILNAMEGGILKLYREACEELMKYREEDNASFREFYRLGAEHAVALRREEEKGYERGLRDGRLFPDEVGPPIPSPQREDTER
jgi:hypothetical protein